MTAAEAATQTLADWLSDRLDEDEAAARECADGRWVTWGGDVWQEGADARIDFPLARSDSFRPAAHIARHDPARVLAEVAAKRAIVEWHKNWPVLVETPPKLETGASDDVNSMTMRMTQQVAWTTEQQYRERFGSEPPTGPVLRHLASVYADHEGYRDEWRP